MTDVYPSVTIPLAPARDTPTKSPIFQGSIDSSYAYAFVETRAGRRMCDGEARI